MATRCTAGLGTSRGERCGRWASSSRDMVVVDGPGGRRLLAGPMCDECWAEVLSRQWFAGAAADDFAPAWVLERLVDSGDPEVLGVLAARGVSLLPASVVERLRSLELHVPENGHVATLMEARAALPNGTTPGHRMATRLLSVTGMVVVAAAVSLLASRLTADHAPPTSAVMGSDSPASSPQSIDSAPSGTTTSLAPETTAGDATSTSTSSMTSNTVARSSVTNVPTTLHVTTTTASTRWWTDAAVMDCVAAVGQKVKITWSPAAGVVSSRVYLDGVLAGSGSGTLAITLTGTEANGGWSVDVQTGSSFAGEFGTLVGAGCL